MPITNSDATPFLMEKCGLSRNASRKLVNDPRGTWELRKIEGLKGHPVGVFPLSRHGETNNGGANAAPQKPVKNKGLFDVDLRQPRPEHAAEMLPPQPTESKGVLIPPISAAGTNFASFEKAGASTNPNAEERPDSEDALVI